METTQGSGTGDPAARTAVPNLHKVSLDAETMLNRKQAASALWAAGFPVSASTLATKAVRGGGPVFRRFGRIPLYKWGDLRRWAEEKLSKPMGSTSEAA
jgi:hypothetical protein